MNKYLYHASQIPNIKILKTNPHNVMDKEPVVFATNDPHFAVAMAYGTGDELGVGYHVNMKTGDKIMYIDELQKGKLKLLSDDCYLYTVESKYFKNDPRIMVEEFVSKQSVPVVKIDYIENVLDYLKENNVEIVEWENVLIEMKKRGKDPSKPKIPHSKDRFKPVNN